MKSIGSFKKSYFLPETIIVILCVLLMGIVNLFAKNDDASHMNDTDIYAAECLDNNNVHAETTETNAAVSTTETTTQNTTTTTQLSSKHRITVPYISQENTLPSGCEIVSAVMLLHYYNYNLTIDDFIDYYLDKENYMLIDGKYYGPDPNIAFVGSPYRSDGLGCYAPVIEKSLDRIVQNKTVRNTTGSSLDDLIREYIVKDEPVLIWASMNMVEISDGFQWTIQGTDETVTWPANEHCLVLVGYDETKYYFNDPYKSNGLVGYSKSLVNARYEDMGKQSVVITY